MITNQIDKLGIQSWCFRKLKDASEIVPALKECDVHNLELCPAHIDIFHNPGEELRRYRDAGITISSFGVYGFGADEGKNRAAFEFAKLAGLPALSADLDLNALELLETLCAEYGVKLAVHNHGRRHPLGSVAVLEDLFRRTSPNIGLCLDTAWMLDSGEDPLAVARKFSARLYGMHLKDFIFDRAGKPEDVVVGSGNIDLPGLCKLLDELHYSGYLTIEYEANPDNPVPALQQCVWDVKAALRSHNA